MLLHVRSRLGCFERVGTTVSLLPVRTLVSSGSLALQASTNSLPREQLTLIKGSDSCGIRNKAAPLCRWGAEVRHPKVRAINLGYRKQQPRNQHICEFLCNITQQFHSAFEVTAICRQSQRILGWWNIHDVLGFSRMKTPPLATQRSMRSTLLPRKMNQQGYLR